MYFRSEVFFEDRVGVRVRGWVCFVGWSHARALDRHCYRPTESDQHESRTSKSHQQKSNTTLGHSRPELYKYRRQISHATESSPSALSRRDPPIFDE